MKQEEQEYIKNLHAIASISGNIVSFSELTILRIKYNLTDKEWENMMGYCNEHDIQVCESKEDKSFPEDTDTLLENFEEEPSAEQNERNELAYIITERIMHLAAVRALKRVNYRGWLCGTYMSSVARPIRLKVAVILSIEEMKYVVSHLPVETEDEEFFNIHTDNLKEADKCHTLNKTLNNLIPKLRINRYLKDVFKEE